MKKLVILLMLGLTQVHAQELQWLVDEHYQRVDKFRQLVYVNSDQSPYLVSYMEHLSPQGGGGGSGPAMSHFIYVHDTSGAFLWKYETDIAPLALLSEEDERFWIVTHGLDSLRMRNGYLQSNAASYGNIYFVELNRQAQVLSHFTWEYDSNIHHFIEDVQLDRNGDFLVLGKFQTSQLQDDSLVFANTTMQLPGARSTHFLIRLSGSGTQLSITTMQSKRNAGPVLLTRLTQNSLNGNILVAGRARDTLFIGNQILYNSTQYRDLLLMEYDENLQYLNGKSFTTSSYGTIPKTLRFNALNGYYYLSGTLGGQLLLIDKDHSVPGHRNSAGNSYVAKFNGINFQQGTYLIPQDSTSYLRGALVADIHFDADTNLRVIANIYDKSFKCGDSLVQLDPNGPNGTDYEIVTLKLDGADLSLQGFFATKGRGQEYAHAAHYDTASGSSYIGGYFNGNFSLDSLSITSTAGEPDAFLMKIKDVNSINLGQDEMQQTVKYALIVYPNPANDRYVKLHFDKSINDLRLFDSSGRELFRASPRTADYRMEIPASLQSGTYYLLINQEICRILIIDSN